VRWCVAMCCSVLQCVAVCCSNMWDALIRITREEGRQMVCCIVQCVAVGCIVLQRDDNN